MISAAVDARSSRLGKVVTIDPRQPDRLVRHSHPVLDHQGREPSAVDQHDGIRDLLAELSGLPGETGRCDEDPLLRAAASERAEECLDLGAPDVTLPTLGLDVDLLQAEFVQRDRAVNPAITRPTRCTSSSVLP